MNFLVRKYAVCLFIDKYAVRLYEATLLTEDIKRLYEAEARYCQLIYVLRL
jgi:hypothetical protein